MYGLITNKLFYHHLKTLNRMVRPLTGMLVVTATMWRTWVRPVFQLMSSILLLNMQERGFQRFFVSSRKVNALPGYSLEGIVAAFSLWGGPDIDMGWYVALQIPTSCCWQLLRPLMTSTAFDEDLQANCLNSKALKGWMGALDAVALATWVAGGINNDLYIL